MEFKEVINRRRSIREFSNKALTKSQMNYLFNAARLSPSAANRQPWKFVVLENDAKNKVADILEKDITKEDLIDIQKPTTYYNAASSLINSIRIIREVPVLILVFRNKDEDWLCGDYLSIGSAVEHIALAAVDINLSSLWIRDVIYKSEEIAKYVKHEKDELVVGMVIGYGTEPYYKINKKGISDIVEWLS